MEPTDANNENSDQLYTPKPGERQLTARAVIAGCILGGLVASMNLYLGLKIGWTVGGSLMAAILGFALFTVLRPKEPYTVLEANITQTSGSGAGTMASAGGLVAPIPAMFMLGYDIPIWGLFLWTASIAYLGVMFAVPLRRQYVVVEKLRFPTGTATANTILAMFATAGEAVAKAKVLLYFGIFAFLYILTAYFIPDLEHPRIHVWVGGATLATLTAWGFSIYIGPVLFGAGFLIGPRVGASLALGAIFGWGVLGYWAQQKGWAPHERPMKIYQEGTHLFSESGFMPQIDAINTWMKYKIHTAAASLQLEPENAGVVGEVQAWAAGNSYRAVDMWGPRGWILWPGVAIMVGDAMMSLGLSWRTFVTAFKGTSGAVAASKDASKGNDEAGALRAIDPDDAIPNTWWTRGLAVAACATIIVAWGVFMIPPYLSIFAILLSSILANVAVRSTGETDINPVGGMGKVTQAAFGALSDSMSTNLMSAGITGAGASQAGDMMQDLKTGYLLGAAPRKQFKAQLFGIATGVLFAVPIFLLFNHAYQIGAEGSRLGAPAAVAWKAVAEVMSRGFDALPLHAEIAMLCGLLFGAAIPVVRKLFPKLAPYTPSGLAFGIAFIVQPYYSLVMFFGSMVLVAWMKIDKAKCERFVFSVACGLIAGEGLAGLVNAILTIFDVPKLFP